MFNALLLLQQACGCYEQPVSAFQLLTMWLMMLRLESRMRDMKAR